MRPRIKAITTSATNLNNIQPVKRLKKPEKSSTV